MMRFFNTAGPIVPADNYFIPPLKRIDQGEIIRLIEQKRYFVLYAPRQTGKTSILLSLREELSAAKKYRPVYLNVESAQVAREDVAASMQAILSELATAAEDELNDFFVREIWQEILASHGPYLALREVLRRWSASDQHPLVLMIDEIDSLVGDSLISVLRQLRTGFPNRSTRFPQSVILCGIRDVRDYRIH